MATQRRGAPGADAPAFVPQTPLVLTAQQSAAKQLADEMAHNRAHGITYGGETRPGGYFIGEDGQPHDAHGNVIDEESEEERATEARRSIAEANKRAIKAAQEREKQARDEGGGGPLNPMTGTGTGEDGGRTGDGPSDAARDAADAAGDAGTAPRKTAAKKASRK